MTVRHTSWITVAIISTAISAVLGAVWLVLLRFDKPRPIVPNGSSMSERSVRKFVSQYFCYEKPEFTDKLLIDPLSTKIAEPAKDEVYRFRSSKWRSGFVDRDVILSDLLSTQSFFGLTREQIHLLLGPPYKNIGDELETYLISDRFIHDSEKTKCLQFAFVDNEVYTFRLFRLGWNGVATTPWYRPAGSMYAK